MDRGNPAPELDAVVRERLEQIRRSGGLPSPKGPAMAIIRLTQRESTTLPVLAHAIKADPAFSVRLIKVANGIGGVERGPVVSVRDAVSVLGVPAVRSLALGFSLLSNYRLGKCAGFDYARFWSHALIRAVAMQLLTAATRGTQTEDAFSVGLLARIGELTLATLFPERYAEIIARRAVAPELRLFDLEQESFVVTHGVLSAAMMLDCGLDRTLTEAVYFFETADTEPLLSDSPEFAAQHLLATADQIADVCVGSPEQVHLGMSRLYQLGSRLSFDPIALAALCERAAHEWREWAAMLGVDSGPVPCFDAGLLVPVVADAGELWRTAAGSDGAVSMRILVVGDEKRIRHPLCAALAAAGHEVVEASDGRRGLAMAIEMQPQIVMVDIAAPQLDGIELTRTLRQFRAGRGIYVVVVAMAGDDGRLIRAFDAGADDFLGLPLQSRALAARLHAGQRVIGLQEALAREQEEVRRIAAELSATSRQLQEVGMTDVLTGCPNRRHAMDRLQQEWAMATRSQRPLACMVINIDNFRQVNETHGHDAGDTVLKLMASAFKDEMRAQDVLARSGGDEFLVICPDTSLEAAMACAERMRAAAETLPIVCGERSARGSVSIGVAVRDSATVDADALIGLADQGAYLAKRRRNAVAAVQAAVPLAMRSAPGND